MNLVKKARKYSLNWSADFGELVRSGIEYTARGFTSTRNRGVIKLLRKRNPQRIMVTKNK